jgi:hypothetical protein
MGVRASRAWKESRDCREVAMIAQAREERTEAEG